MVGESRRVAVAIGLATMILAVVGVVVFAKIEYWAAAAFVRPGTAAALVGVIEVVIGIVLITASPALAQRIASSLEFCLDRWRRWRAPK